MRTALITTCSAEKADDPGLLPAVERYTHPRILAAARAAERRGLDFYILSGEFGLLGPQEPIPWYDHALQADEVGALSGPVASRLRAAGMERIEAWLEPRDAPGWAPYYDLLEQAARAAAIELVWGQDPSLVT